MTRAELVTQLRDRPRAGGHLSDAELAARTDDELIESYVTCSGCGARQLAAPGELARAIADARDAQDFFELADQRSGHPLWH